jgi:hypothetical protein
MYHNSSGLVEKYVMATDILIAPRGGLNLSLPADLISMIEMSDCRNVFSQEGMIKKRYGYKTLGGNLPLPGVVVGFDQFYLFDGTSYLIVVTTVMPFYLASPTSSPYWETLHENEVEDDCETTWTSDMGANGAVADETTIKKVGSTAQKISPAAGFTTGLMAHRNQSLGDKSSYSYIRFWIRSSVAQAEGDLQFCIDNTAGCGSPTETLDIPALEADTWKLVFLACSDPASNMTSIESLGLSCAADNGACNIYIDDIRFVKSFSSSNAYDTVDEDFASYDYIRKTTETDPWWILTNGVDAIKYFTGTGSISSLVSTYPSGVTALLAKIVIEFKSHLLLMDVSEDGNRYPQRVRWSDTSDPEDFLNGNASSQDLTGTDWIKGAVKFRGDYLVIVKGKSVWLGYATGESDIFQFDLKDPKTGTPAGKTIAAIGEEVIFMGWDDIYSFDGITCDSIAENVRDEIFSDVNPSAIEKSFGVVIEELKEYWLFIVSASDDYPDIAWVFNYDIRKWTRHKFADFLTAYGYYTLQSSLTIGDLVGTIGEQNWRIGSRATLASAPVTLFGDTGGYVYQYDNLTNNDNGTAINAWFSTKDFNPTAMQGRFGINRIDVYYIGQGLDVSYSVDKGKTWTLIKSLGVSNDLETPNSLYLKLDCLMCRLRFRNAESGEHFEFSRANIFWRPTGRRL